MNEYELRALGEYMLRQEYFPTDGTCWVLNEAEVLVRYGVDALLTVAERERLKALAKRLVEEVRLGTD
jgi:hypothetical protein